MSNHSLEIKTLVSDSVSNFFQKGYSPTFTQMLCWQGVHNLNILFADGGRFNFITFKGHQDYAKILDKKVSDDMKLLKEKLCNKSVSNIHTKAVNI